MLRAAFGLGDAMAEIGVGRGLPGRIGWAAGSGGIHPPAQQRGEGRGARTRGGQALGGLGLAGRWGSGDEHGVGHNPGYRALG